MAALNMNYLKTFKPNIHTFDKPLPQKWAIRVSLQLNLTQKKS